MGAVLKLRARAHRWAVIAGTAVGILVLLLLIGGVLYLRNRAEELKKQSTSTKSQSLNDADLEEASQGHVKVGDSDKSLTISGKTFFKEAVSFDGSLEIKEDVTGSGKSTWAELSVAGPSELNGATIKTKLDVEGPVSFQGNVTAQALSVTGALNVTGNSSFGGALTVKDITIGNTLTVGGHHISGGPTPGIAVASAAGAGASANIAGNDTAGTFSCNAGADATAGTICQISFVSKYGGNPRVMVAPASNGAAELRWYVASSVNGFSIVATTHSALGNRSYSFNYWVTQ
jgi:cytoskeletal protein CcmA (bactofilin family)